MTRIRACGCEDSEKVASSVFLRIGTRTRSKHCPNGCFYRVCGISEWNSQDRLRFSQWKIGMDCPWLDPHRVSKGRNQYGGGRKKGIKVIFLDQTGTKSVNAVIADIVAVKRILPNVITKINLPVMVPNGQTMSYSLDPPTGQTLS